MTANAPANANAIRKIFPSLITSELSKGDITNLEIAIFNWSIDFANSKHIIRNWENIQFRKIYINKCISIIFNLNPNNNPVLYNKIIKGEITVDKLPYMKPDDLFPENWVDINKKLREMDKAKNNNEHITYTDQFKCGKCKQRKTTYYTQQTRSADEPETIFIRCANCGNQWKC